MTTFRKWNKNGRISEKMTCYRIYRTVGVKQSLVTETSSLDIATELRDTMNRVCGWGKYSVHEIVYKGVVRTGMRYVS